MAYDFYLGETLLPVAPPKMRVKIKGQNKTITLINEGEINILKKPGLTDYTFDALLPSAQYPFGQYVGGFKPAQLYIDELERLKTNVDDSGKPKPFQFIMYGNIPNGKILFQLDVKVALEDYAIDYDVKDGFDAKATINLRQYKSYGTKTVTVKPPGEGQPQATATAETPRPAESAPNDKSHTVIKGDCLWAIAKKYLGDGSRYPEIYELNKTEIDARNKGTGNTKYTIYPGQVFALP
jgi:hypothetical protein